MRTNAPLLVAVALTGCIQPVASEAEIVGPDTGDLAAELLAALGEDDGLYFADATGGPYPHYLYEYLEEGDTVAEGLELVPAWGGRSIARSPGGRELFLAYHDAPPSVRIVVLGELPEGSRPHLLLDGDDPYQEFRVVLADEAAGTAEVLDWSSHVAPRSLPLARAPDGEIGAPGLDETVALRWLKTCPDLLEECALYGSPDEVAAARDPIEPEGGWFLHPRPAVLDPPANARFVETQRYEGDGGDLFVESAPAGLGLYDIPQAFYRVWLEVNGRRVHAFDFITDDDTFAFAGVGRDGDRLIAWLWRPEQVAASLSEHDARTGERIGEPVTLEGEMYYEPGCNNGITGTRPMPVRVGDELAFALWWGEREVLLFDGRSSYGSPAEVDVDPDAESFYDAVGEHAPPILRLAR